MSRALKSATIKIILGGRMIAEYRARLQVNLSCIAA